MLGGGDALMKHHASVCLPCLQLAWNRFGTIWFALKAPFRSLPVACTCCAYLQLPGCSSLCKLFR